MCPLPPPLPPPPAPDRQPPQGSPPDLYIINITQIDPKTGDTLSATNSIPYRNTTAVIGDLQDGNTYRFVVQVSCAQLG